MQGQPGMEGYGAPSGPSAPKMGDVNPAMAEPPMGANPMGQAVNPNISTQ